jgi:predicted TIM-barrel fold metal-dependent hydrolase
MQFMAPQLSVPPNACDCHLHIFDPRFREVLPADDMSAMPCTASAYAEIQRALKIDRAVVVTPRNYDTDNAVTVDAIAQMGLHRARGVAVLRPDVRDSTLGLLHEQGIRGIRFTLYTPEHAPTSFDMVEPLAARVKKLGWHLQLHWTADQIVAHEALLDRLPVEVVFDHLGRLPVATGLHHPAAAIIERLLREGRAWMKLSAPYLDSVNAGQGNDEDLDKVAKHWIEVAPYRVVWGSDWPHTSLKSPPSTAIFLKKLFSWVDDQTSLDRILVSNPTRLYWDAQA